MRIGHRSIFTYLVLRTPYLLMTHGSLRLDGDKTEFQIAILNQQSRHFVNEHQLIEAASTVLADSAFTSAAISLAIVDDETIHELNRRHLDHDWPTDVLSFVLDEHNGHLEGEVIISADTAAAAAEELGCTTDSEQLLYVIHGMLHLVGYGDKSESETQE